MARSLVRVLLTAVLLVASGQGRAQPPQQIELEVLVSHISDQPGSIDPRAQKLHAQLKKEFRYESVRVLDQRKLRLGIDDIGRVELPNGRLLRVKPLLVDDKGVLLSVDLENTLKSDFRVKSGHLVVIGAQQYEDGKLVISLEPTF